MESEQKGFRERGVGFDARCLELYSREWEMPLDPVSVEGAVAYSGRQRYIPDSCRACISLS